MEYSKSIFPLSPLAANIVLRNINLKDRTF